MGNFGVLCKPMNMKRIGTVLALLTILLLTSPTVWGQEGDGGIGANEQDTSHITLLQDIEYVRRDGISYRLDICQPKKLTSKVPAIILTHGGGFGRGSKKDLRDECAALANMGYVGVAVDYRLTDVAPYPAQIDDVQYAVRWIRSNANKYFIDPTKLGSLGGSAGGYLATMLGVRDTRNIAEGLSEFSSQVQVVIARSGIPMDATTASTLPDPNAPFKDALNEITTKYLKGYTQTTELAREISAVTYVTSKSAPLLAVHSVNDRLAPIANAFAIVNALKGQGVEAQVVSFQGIGNAHGRSRLPVSEQNRLWNIETQFLRTHLLLSSVSSPTINVSEESKLVKTSPKISLLSKGRPLLFIEGILIVAFAILVHLLMKRKKGYK